MQSFSFSSVQSKRKTTPLTNLTFQLQKISSHAHTLTYNLFYYYLLILLPACEPASLHREQCNNKKIVFFIQIVPRAVCVCVQFLNRENKIYSCEVQWGHQTYIKPK